MAAGRAPVDRVVDFALFAPVGAAIAVSRSVPLLVRAGRRGIGRLAAVVTVTEPAAPAMVTEMIDETSPDTERVAAETDEHGDTSAVEELAVETLPLDDYDHLAARQVVDRLGSLSADDLALIERYEQTHRHRRTILGKIEQLRA